MADIDLTKIPEGGWTEENMLAYGRERRRLDALRPKEDWEDVEDPTGRLRKGMRIRWRSVGESHPTMPASMVILNLCAPVGLWRKPIPAEDRSPVAQYARAVGIYTLSCDKSDPEATYYPDGLMVHYLSLDEKHETTVQASAVEEAP